MQKRYFPLGTQNCVTELLISYVIQQACPCPKMQWLHPAEICNSSQGTVRQHSLSPFFLAVKEIQ